MEKGLYRVRVALFVMAENESDACVAATQARFNIFECAARNAKIINPDWRDAIPYNTDKDRTCSEIMRTRHKMTTPEARLVNSPAYIKVGVRTFEIENRSVQSGQQN